MLISGNNTDTLLRCFNHLTLSVFEKIPEGVMINDAIGTVVYVNKKFTELFGYSSSELVGLCHKQVISLLLGKHHVNQHKEIRADWTKIINGDSTIKRRKFTHKEGQTVALEAKAFPIFNEDKLFSGEVVFFKDLHEELLVAITQLVNSSLSLKEVLDNTVKAVVEYLGLASNTIFLLDEEKVNLDLVTCTVFPNEAEIRKVSFKLGQGVPGMVAASRKKAYVKNLHTDPLVSEQARKYHGDESCMAYPLICKEEVLGVITFNADTVREFNAKEHLMFENISNQVALAVYNAQVFSQLQHLSITDGLTGLYNHRYLQERLKEEIKRAERTKAYLSLILLDVDNFKNYNDSFGHVSGDELLKQIAILIQQNVRSIDVVARYGGEEFAVILIGCSKEEAMKISERIKISIEEYDFFGREKQPGGKVTVSIGLTMFTEPEDNKQLLNNADCALYKAKRTGKNKVEVVNT